jgi:nitrite reductase (NADH) small subunit
MKRYRIADAREIRENGRQIVTVKGMEIGVFLVDGEYRAYRSVCPHAGAPVCEGTVGGTNLPSSVYEYEYGQEEQILCCPWHGWEFDLKTGENLVNPRTRLRSYPVEVKDFDVYLLLR